MDTHTLIHSSLPSLSALQSNDSDHFVESLNEERQVYLSLVVVVSERIHDELM